MAPRPWQTQRLPEIVGTKGACKILGVQKMTLNRWMKADSGQPWSTHGPRRTFMIEPRRVDDGDGGEGWPVWAKADIERFAEEVGRQRAPADQAASASH